MELAKLLLKLGQSDKAEAALNNVKNSPEKALVLAKVGSSRHFLSKND